MLLFFGFETYFFPWVYISNDHYILLQLLLLRTKLRPKKQLSPLSKSISLELHGSIGAIIFPLFSGCVDPLIPSRLSHMRHVDNYNKHDKEQIHDGINAPRYPPLTSQ